MNSIVYFYLKELMEEGRKLSLQLGNANTALRKLRAKEKENEGELEVGLRRIHRRA